MKSNSHSAIFATRTILLLFRVRVLVKTAQQATLRLGSALAQLAATPAELNAIVESWVAKLRAAHTRVRATVGSGQVLVTLRVYDISDPSKIALRATLPVATTIRDLMIDGTTLYAALGPRILAAYDLTTPFNPLLKGTAVINSSALIVANNRAYAALNNRLLIYDISAISQPVLLGSYEPAQPCLEEFSDPTTPTCATELSINGDRAYLQHAGDTTAILDIRTPSAITRLGTISTLGSLIAAVGMTQSRVACIASRGVFVRQQLRYRW